MCVQCGTAFCIQVYFSHCTAHNSGSSSSSSSSSSEVGLGFIHTTCFRGYSTWLPGVPTLLTLPTPPSSASDIFQVHLDTMTLSGRGVKLPKQLCHLLWTHNPVSVQSIPQIFCSPLPCDALMLSSSLSCTGEIQCTSCKRGQNAFLELKQVHSED
jgi:hypothetical protein